MARPADHGRLASERTPRGRHVSSIEGSNRPAAMKQARISTMPEATTYYLTTAIDYPNSRPHIGTAFEKIGADVQARFRRMEGFAVHFQMGNDENTGKVLKRAREL